ncbi:MAG: DUF5121 domain-containing protein [Prevotellaceae bacterium]|jgi:glucosylceramidase|nr:DUF5121 domain-containing protein [Prevotellaceae bacterium]
MKKELHALAIAALLFNVISAGCETKENETPAPTKPDDHMLLKATPAGPLVLDENNGNKVALTFTWAPAANRGEGMSITYRFQLSLQGSPAVWEPGDAAVVQGRRIGFTHDELSALITDTLGATPGQPVILEATVTAEVIAAIPMLPETSSVSIEITPYGEKKNINGVLMTKVGANEHLFSVDLTITQNHALTVGGMDISDWWIDPDFFTKTGDRTLSFLPITGKYRILADVERKYFKVQVMSGDALASLQEDGSGAVWAIGNVGNPTIANLVDWNPSEAVCLAPIGNGRYKLSGVGGQRFRTGELGIKFQPRHDAWDAIERPDTGNETTPKYGAINNNFILIDDGDNVHLKNGWTLLSGGTYTFIIDVSGGYRNIQINIMENGAPPADPATRNVIIYISTADRSMTFRRTGVNFNTAPGSSPVITLHPEETYQEMDGFGAALTWASCYNLLRMDAASRAAFLKETFDPVEGVGFSYVRVSIGASDFSSHNYTCCDQQGIENFALPPEDIDVVIPILKEVLTFNPNLKIMGSPWTCPRWMKVMTKRGSLSWNQYWYGYLKPSYYHDYATYFVKWIQAFEAQGVPIYSITPQNEPLNPGNSTSLRMDWDEQRDFIKALGPKLREAGLNTKIYVFDHNYNYDDMSDQQDYPIKIYDDPEAAQYVAGAAYHNYGGSPDELDDIHNQRPDKGLVFTEASIGEWSDGRSLVSNNNFANGVEEGIMLANKWCKGVIVWNLMLDMNKGPYNTDGEGCRTCYGTVDISDDYQTVTRNCHYYEVGHLAQVVKPGAYRIKSDGYNELPYAAFVNADGSYALVVVNKTGGHKSFTVNDGTRSFSYTLPHNAAASIRWK